MFHIHRVPVCDTNFHTFRVTRKANEHIRRLTDRQTALNPTLSIVGSKNIVIVLLILTIIICDCIAYVSLYAKIVVLYIFVDIYKFCADFFEYATLIGLSAFEIISPSTGVL
jgi:hypothetical protein